MSRLNSWSARAALGGLACILTAFVSRPVVAQVGSECNGLAPIAQALCVTYCDVAHCTGNPNAACQALRTQYQGQTGHAAFPCDCGDGVVEDGEGCDPPGSASCGNAGNGLQFCDNRCQCDCPSHIEFEGTPGSLGVLDSGWTGQAHNATVVDHGKLSVSVTSCANSVQPCGVCNLTGPVPNAQADHGDINNRRCTGNTRTKCSTNADCSVAGGTCEYYFGTLLPLSAGGVSTCVSNQVNGAVTGTADVASGASATDVELISRIYTGTTVATPCPKCVGDATPNDGVRGGTCDSGVNSGQSCDVNGSSPNVFFGATSLDCPPTSGAQIAALPIDLSNSTGTVSRTLATSSPSCRAPGFTTLKCFCDTCNNGAAQPCATNADCPDPAGPIGPICGGKRCIGGTNPGAACTTATECPSGACNVPGTATAPNQCSDATCSPTTGNEGECSGGPFEQFCGPDATFAGCTTDADCASFTTCSGGSNPAQPCSTASQCPGGTCAAQQTCSVGKFRPCFTDNGAAGASIQATGATDPPVNSESNPTLAALFCIGPTTSGSVNSVAGLPGPGRLELPGHARELR